MKKEDKIFVTCDELAEQLGVSKSTSYRIIRNLNRELAKEGWIVIPGRVSREFLKKRYFGYGA